MHIFSTSLLVATFLGAAVNPGWCPEPANLGAPASSWTGATAAAPLKGRQRINPGLPAQARGGLQAKSYTSRGAATGHASPTIKSYKLNASALVPRQVAKPVRR